jgi:hypothetical protein
VASWALRLLDLAGATVQASMPFRSLTARWVLNGPGSLEVDFRSSENLGGADPGLHILQLERDGTNVWSGPLVSADVDPDARSVKLEADGWASILGLFVVTTNLDYVAVNQQQVAWNLINHFQGLTQGAWGLTQGVHTGGNVTRTVSYCGNERPNVLDEVNKWTGLDDGLDWEVDPFKAFNTWQPQRKTATAIALTQSNVDELKWIKSARDLRDYITGIGSDDCGPVLADVADTTIASTYKRRQAAISGSWNTTNETTAEAREELRALKHPRFDASVVFRDGAASAPAWGTYPLGSTLTLQDSRGYSTFGPSTLRVMEISVSIEAPTSLPARVELRLGSAVD